MTSNSEGGFTLAEVLVVMAIMALAAAIALPSLKAREAERLVLLLTDRVAAILQESRLKAIGQNRTVTVTFDSNDKNFTKDGEAAATVPEDLELDLLTARGDSFNGDPSFRFFPDGSSTGGSITLTKGDVSSAIKVRWLTGQIEVQRQPNDPK
jgi:general secretion pathway protein H